MSNEEVMSGLLHENIGESKQLSIEIDSLRQRIEKLENEQRQKKGRWILLIDGYHCSNCNYKLQMTGIPMYCPNCGAEMRGEE